MGLSDLFKPKAPKLKPDPRIRWFGKLPTYADYYRSTTDEAWAVEFNDWILKGFEVYQRRRPDGAARGGRLPMAVCVVRLPKSGMTAFASIQDYGGDMRGRPFPICFYAGVPTADWPGPTSGRLAAASRAVRDLMALRREVPRFLNAPGRLETHFGEREVDLSGIDGETQDVSWVEQARKISLREWITGAAEGLNVEDPQMWFRAVARWGDRIAELESKSFAPTLRFPLAMGLPVGVQMAGWLRWLESRMDLKRRCLTIMVSGELERTVGYLSVIAREVVPEDFLLITNAADALSCVDSLSDVKPTDGGAENEDEPNATGERAGPTGTWADFVGSAAAVA